jgi:glutamate racemase
MINSLGIYDTGIGGLSLIKGIKNFSPNLSITYLADTGFYTMENNNTVTTLSRIQNRAKTAIKTLFSLKCNLVLLASYQATTSALIELQNRWIKTEYSSSGKYVIGTSLPISQKLIDSHWDCRDEICLLLAASSTIRTGYYQQEALKIGFHNLFAIPTDALDRAVEFGDEKDINNTLNDILHPFKEIVLKAKIVLPASTHYYWIYNFIKSKFPATTFVLDPLEETAQGILKFIDRHPEYKIENGNIQYYTTGNTQDIKKKIKKYLDTDEQVKSLTLE